MVGEVASTVVVKGGAGIAGIGGVLKFLFFTHLRWTISLILILFTVISSLGACMEQRSAFPLVKNIGGDLLSKDEGLYWTLKDIESNGWRLPIKEMSVDEPDGFWKDVRSALAKISFVFDTLSTFWYIYIVTYLFYLLFKVMNTGSIIMNISLAILVVVFLQISYGSIMLYLNDPCNAEHVELCLPLEEKYSNAFFSLTPLKGTYFLVENLINGNLITLFTESAVAYPVEVNATNNTVNWDILNNFNNSILEL